MAYEVHLHERDPAITRTLKTPDGLFIFQTIDQARQKVVEDQHQRMEIARRNIQRIRLMRASELFTS